MKPNLWLKTTYGNKMQNTKAKGVEWKPTRYSKNNCIEKKPKEAVI